MFCQRLQRNTLILSFVNQDTIQILDTAGQNITEEFFERHTEHYKNGELLPIVEELENEQHLIVSGSVESQKMADSSAQTRGVTQLTATFQGTQYYKSLLNGQQTHYYITVKAQGKYMHDATNSASQTLPALL